MNGRRRFILSTFLFSIVLFVDKHPRPSLLSASRASPVDSYGGYAILLHTLQINVTQITLRCCCDYTSLLLRLHFGVTRDYNSMLLRLHFGVTRDYTSLLLRLQINVVRDYNSMLREITLRCYSDYISI
jgi:hypothetical protein